MRSPLVSALALIVLASTAAPARAQDIDDFGYYGAAPGEEDYASPQMFALELRFSPYRPEIDSEFSGASPYNEMFGSDHRLMLGAEFDWQALRLERIASFGVGFGLGYTRMTAGMLREDEPGERAGQETSLSIMPVWAAAVARLDVLARQTVVPLAFYGKLGPATSLWWVKDGSGTAEDGDDLGKGRSDGLIYGLGIMLALDKLDPNSARTLDNGTGVNHTYLFGEWTVLDLGTSSQMLVGDNTWTLGLALEF